jgi:hypothetical protein
LAIALVVTAMTMFRADVSAHRRDEYLQAARIAIEPRQIELQLDLTPGIAVAEAVLAEIDRDGDGVLSPEEQHAYVTRVLSALHLDLDQQPLHVEPTTFNFPAMDAIKHGEGTIQLQLHAALPPLPAGTHHVSYRNTHRPDISAYLANTLVPESTRVAIQTQARDIDQHDLTIDYVLRSDLAASANTWLPASLTGAPLVAILLLRWRERSRTSRIQV